VGLVIGKDEFTATGQSTEAIFQHWVDASPPLAKCMAGAQAIGPWQITGDFSYLNRKLAADRVLCVVDAAGFMDPIFSAGVFLAMWSGKLAAEVVAKSVERGDNGARWLAVKRPLHRPWVSSRCRRFRRVWRRARLWRPARIIAGRNRRATSAPDRWAGDRALPSE